MNFGVTGSGYYLFLEMKDWGDPANNYAVIYDHNLKNDGKVKQIDCICYIGGVTIRPDCFSHLRETSFPEGVSIKFSYSTTGKDITCYIP